MRHFKETIGSTLEAMKLNMRNDIHTIGYILEFMRFNIKNRNQTIGFVLELGSNLKKIEPGIDIGNHAVQQRQLQLGHSLTKPVVLHKNPWGSIGTTSTKPCVYIETHHL